jgi:hypothetical protein
MIRCKKCKRFTRNNRCDVRSTSIGEHVANERGDCSRCGQRVRVESEGWEDWFGWKGSYDDRPCPRGFFCVHETKCPGAV